MQYLVDTNILLRLADRNHPLHPVVRQAIRNLRSNKHQLCITPQNCAEFWNVATRPADRNGFGLSPQQADQQLKLIQRLFILLPDSPEIYKQWRRLVGLGCASPRCQASRSHEGPRHYPNTHIEQQRLREI